MADHTITRIRGYRQFQPFRDGSYGTSSGAADGFDSMIIAVDTTGSVTGWGETAPLGSFYAAAFAAGARAAAAELAPALIGIDPRRYRVVAQRLDAALRGHPYAKSAFSIACWDAASRLADQPLCEALGAGVDEQVTLYQALPPAGADAMAARAQVFVARGYRHLQVKVGAEPDLDADRIAAVRAAVGEAVWLVADANGAYTTGAARRFLARAGELLEGFEQPCATLDECIAIRDACPLPLRVDESIETLGSLLAARRGGIDGVTIKLARVGGITPALLLRDVACDLGMTVTIEDTGGASIDTAAILHVSASTPAQLRRPTVDFNTWVTVDNATGLKRARQGRTTPPRASGLGVNVRAAALGEPFLVEPAAG